MQVNLKKWEKVVQLWVFFVQQSSNLADFTNLCDLKHIFYKQADTLS